MVAQSNDIEDIYRRMAVIRREPHAGVSESVAAAEAVVDWGRYAWTYPWIALGAAAAAGCLVYRGSRQMVTVVPANDADAAKSRNPVEEDRPKEQERKRTLQSLLFAVGGIVLPVAINAGQNYMLRWLEHQYPTRPVAKAAPAHSVGDPADRWDQSRR